MKPVAAVPLFRLAVLSLVCLGHAAGTTETRTFFSPTKNREYSYTIWLPPGYADAGNTRRYPVIYELQNTSFRGYMDRTATLRADWKQHEHLLVQFDPGGEGCIYSPGGVRDGRPSGMETVLIEQLIPHVESGNRVWPYRQARAIYGVSKAGGGCTRIAIKYAWMFSATTPLDGCIALCDDYSFRSYPDNYSILPFDYYKGNVMVNLPALEYMPVHMFSGSNGSLNFWGDGIAYYPRFVEWGMKRTYIYNLTNTSSYCTGRVICNSGAGFNCGHGSLCTDWLKDSCYSVLVGALAFAGALEPPAIEPQGPPVHEGFDGPQTVTLSHEQAGVEIRYTLDGTTPTRQSTRYAGPFTVAKSVMVVARAFTAADSSTGNSSLIRLCRPGVLAADTVPGLTYGAFTLALADLNKSCGQLNDLTPQKSGIATLLPNASAYRTASSNYGLVFDGLFKAETSGRYGFAADFTGRFKMWVAGVLVCDSDSLHPKSWDWRDGGRVMLSETLCPAPAKGGMVKQSRRLPFVCMAESLPGNTRA